MTTVVEMKTPCDLKVYCAALVMACAILGGDGCGPGPSTPDEPDVSVEEPTRAFALASRAEGYQVGESSPRIFDLGAVEVLLPPDPPVVAEGEVGTDASGATSDATDSEEWVPRIPLEAVVVPVDLLGVPWDSFDGPAGAPTDLPAPWLSALNGMLEGARESGLPLVVALSPLSENWDALAARPEGDASTLSLDPLWKPYCYDPSLDGDPLRDQEA
ncbi:MAG: hypothetical protein VX938_09715, partial [Myxococcota bacterium]|nr:hypothetical protein [Myxococcota bacterium]